MNARLFLTLALLTLATSPAGATIITVPGDYATVQEVLDAGCVSDTIRILVTVQPERLDIHHECSPTLIGVPDSAGTLPRLGAMTIVECDDIRLQSLHIDGPVYTGIGTPIFRGCQVDSTIHSIGGSDPAELRIFSCTLNGHPAISGTCYVRVDSCHVKGSIVLGSHPDGTLVAYDNVIEGPGEWGINATTTWGTDVARNTIRGFENGIYMSCDGDVAIVRENVIEDCPGTGIVGGPTGSTTVRSNTIRNCGTGIRIEHADGTVQDNTVMDCAYDGIVVEPDYSASIHGNVVARSGAAGLVIRTGHYGDIPVHNNTSYGNGGAGFDLTVEPNSVYAGMRFTNNIAFTNQGLGVQVEGPPSPTTACNDWFGNGAGEFSGFVPSASDRSVDPLFCDVLHDDVHLRADSPLLGGDCGLVGALGQGCVAPTAVETAQERAFGLTSVMPNPGMGVTRIEFTLTRSTSVELDVFDVQGRHVARLRRGVLPAGNHVTNWSGSERGIESSGLYFVRLRTPEGNSVRRLVRSR